MIKDTTNKIINKLTQQEKEEGNLPLLLDFYKKLVIVQAEAQANIGDIEPTIDVDAISLRLNQGQPLVAFEELAIDWPLLKDVFSRVAEVFAQYPQLFGDSPKRLTVPAAGRLLTKNAVKAWYEGRTLPPSLREGLSGNLVQAILQATLHPFLKKHALALIQYIGDDSWRRNYCPVCGGIPDFSYLETEVAGRYLVCSRCDTEWQYQRLQCPYCRNQDQSLLTFLEDEQGLYRLYQCKKCQCYLKAIDLRKVKDEVLIPLERFYTIHLDTQAQEMGYHPYFPSSDEEKNG